MSAPRFRLATALQVVSITFLSWSEIIAFAPIMQRSFGWNSCYSSFSNSGGYGSGASSTCTSTSTLHAKATKKKKKKNPAASAAGGGGGGFGGRKVEKEDASSKAVDDDYAAFPALEKNVRDSLVPAIPIDNEDGVSPSLGEGLSPEIIDRLAQIYGFPKFNTNFEHNETEEEEESNNISLVSDLLQPKPSSKGADFADLLAGTTGGSMDSSSKRSGAGASLETIRLTKQLPLSGLPPFFNVKVLHVDPLVLSVQSFLTDEECDRYVQMSESPSTIIETPKDAPLQTQSKTVGKDTAAKSQRTSTTWFHHFRQLPELVAKGSRLLGLEAINQWEEPQTVRYRRKERFTWHLDALGPSESLNHLGGQRTATLLVYLTDMKDKDGGATMFRDLGGGRPLKVKPTKGSALLFFPAAGGIPNCPFDIRTLHSGEVISGDASADKWIAQMWLRQSSYKATAPPGNTHASADQSISSYCNAIANN